MHETPEESRDFPNKDKKTYQKNRLEKFKAEGKCSGGCGRSNEDGMLQCRKCRKRSADYRRKKVKAGLCQVCFGRQVEEGKAKTCSECKASVKKREAIRKAKLAADGICYRCGIGELLTKSGCIDCMCKGRDRIYGLPAGTFKEVYLNLKKCQSCDKDISVTNLSVSDRPHLDHDHDTGKVRGLICKECNLALGLMKEDPVRIRALANYIETHKPENVG